MGSMAKLRRLDALLPLLFSFGCGPAESHVAPAERPQKPVLDAALVKDEVAPATEPACAPVLPRTIQARADAVLTVGPTGRITEVLHGGKELDLCTGEWTETDLGVPEPFRWSKFPAAGPNGRLAFVAKVDGQLCVGLRTKEGFEDLGATPGKADFTLPFVGERSVFVVDTDGVSVHFDGRVVRVSLSEFMNAGETVGDLLVAYAQGSTTPRAFVIDAAKPEARPLSSWPGFERSITTSLRGGRVLVVAEHDSKAVAAIDPVADRRTDLPALVEEKSVSAAVELTDGTVVIVGHEALHALPPGAKAWQRFATARPREVIEAAAPMPDGRMLLLANGRSYFFDPRSGMLESRAARSGRLVALSPKRTLIVTNEGIVSREAGRYVFEGARKIDDRDHLSAARLDDTHVILVRDDGGCEVYDDGKKVYSACPRLIAKKADVRTLAADTNGRTFAVTAPEGGKAGVTYWSLEAGAKGWKKIVTSRNGGYWIDAVILRDGSLLVTSDGWAERVRDGKIEKVSDVGTSAVELPDGRIALRVFRKGYELWNVASGTRTTIARDEGALDMGGDLSPPAVAIDGQAYFFGYVVTRLDPAAGIVTRAPAALEEDDEPIQVVRTGEGEILTVAGENTGWSTRLYRGATPAQPKP